MNILVNCRSDSEGVEKGEGRQRHTLPALAWVDEYKLLEKKVSLFKFLTSLPFQTLFDLYSKTVQELYDPIAYNKNVLFLTLEYHTV